MNKITLELLEQLRSVLSHAEEMGCNCATLKQINRGHAKDCPANQRNHLFLPARRVMAKAEKLILSEKRVSSHAMGVSSKDSASPPPVSPVSDNPQILGEQ